MGDIPDFYRILNKVQKLNVKKVLMVMIYFKRQLLHMYRFLKQTDGSSQIELLPLVVN